MKEQVFHFLVSGFLSHPVMASLVYCVAVFHEVMQPGPMPETLL